MKKVLCHEITHAAMFSYNVNLSLEQEELVADLISTYGEEIVYMKDKSIKAVVVGDKKVRYGKETMTLTWLAKKLLKKKHGIPWPDYFLYKWKKLNDIRREKGLIKF